MRTSNPTLNDNVFNRNRAINSTDRMTIDGTVNKCLLLILLVFGFATISWQSAFPNGWSAGSAPQIPGWYLPVTIAAFVVALVAAFKKPWAPILAPLYAILEGLVLGAVSVLFEFQYPGIVMHAVMGTMGTFFALLMAYKSGMIKATENFKLGVVAATGGICIVYLVDIGLSFFGKSVPLIHESSTTGILFSVGVVIIAALNLVLDFDFIEKGAEQGSAKYMEWYAAFGLLVTLVWLYLEILRLLAKSRKK